MRRYRKKPVIIHAAQWLRPGDLEEIVEPYRCPRRDGDQPCKHCGRLKEDHGWIRTLEGGHIVCPGDYIIRGVEGEHYPCKPQIFEATYETVEEEEEP